MNTDSGNRPKVFTLRQNGCSHKTRTGVHFKSESVFTLGQNTQLTANPALFHGKVVFVHGYLNFITRGPYAGYWLSSDNHGVPYGNSLVLEFPEDAPQRKWIENGEKYSVRGVFKDCRPQALYSQNCYLKISPISESGIIEVMPINVE